MSNAPFQDVLDQAEREKERSAKYHKRAARFSRIKQRWNQWRAPKPINTESFRTYWKVTPKSAMSLWDLGFLLSTTFFVVSLITATANQPWSLFIKIPGGLAILFGMILFVKYTLVALGYVEYRGWRKTLPFPLTGWDEFFQKKQALSSYHWQVDSTVRIDLTADASRHTKVIDAMIYLFCKSANGWIYDTESPVAGFSGDPRRTWKRMGNEIHGSMNVSVMGEVQKLVQQLGKLAKTDPVITGVHLSYGTSVAEVSPIEYSPNP
jgi:hypothetical protein